MWIIRQSGATLLSDPRLLRKVESTSTIPCRLALFLYLLFGVKKSQFKKANAAEVKKNKIHMKKWMRKYEKDIGDTD